MKKETFEHAKKIEKEINSISEHLSKLKPDNKTKLICVKILSECNGFSNEFELKFSSVPELKLAGVSDKTKEMIIILSQTYREHLISLLKSEKMRAINDFKQLEDTYE